MEAWREAVPGPQCGGLGFPGPPLSYKNPIRLILQAQVAPVSHSQVLEGARVAPGTDT